MTSPHFPLLRSYSQESRASSTAALILSTRSGETHEEGGEGGQSVGGRCDKERWRVESRWASAFVDLLGLDDESAADDEEEEGCCVSFDGGKKTGV